MDWLNIHHTVLSSEEYIDSEPTARATWLNLIGFCSVHENGGRVVGARLWKDRKCQQLLRVTREELDDESMLWTWEGDDAIVTFYPTEKEELVKSKRSAGAKGGKSKSQAKAKAARMNGAKQNPSRTQAEPKQEANGREGKGIGKEKERNHTTTASADADAGSKEEFYLTRRKRKLTGKRLETFDRFWKTFAYPKGKAEAADAWLDIPSLTVAMVDEICAAAAKEAENRAAIIRAGKTPKYAQGWITGRRWEDYDKAEQPPKPSALPAHPADWQTHRKTILERMERDGVPERGIAKVRDAKTFDDLPNSIKDDIRAMTAK